MIGKDLRVLNLCETARGGVGTYQRHIAGLEDRGIEMHHVVPAQDVDFLGDNLRVYAFDRQSRGNKALVAMLREFGAQMRALRPDLCFFHSSFALAGLAGLRARSDRTPALYCPHGWAMASYPDGSIKSRVIRSVESRLGGLADRVVCVSNHEKALAVENGYRGRFTVIENAVPDARADARSDLFAAEPEALHLLFVGRLDRQKGFDLLVDALRKLDRTDIRLHVVGGAVRDSGPQMDLPANARMAGWVSPDRVDDWYASADALIVPSRWEAFGLVVPEALRNGLPVLCSDRGALPDLVEDGRTGRHFALAVPDIAAVLRSLDKSRLRQMRPACRSAYEARFQIGRLLDSLEHLMKEVWTER